MWPAQVLMLLTPVLSQRPLLQLHTQSPLRRRRRLQRRSSSAVVCCRQSSLTTPIQRLSTPQPLQLSESSESFEDADDGGVALGGSSESTGSCEGGRRRRWQRC